jgi:hypothetical protein
VLSSAPELVSGGSARIEVRAVPDLGQSLVDNQDGEGHPVFDAVSGKLLGHSRHCAQSGAAVPGISVRQCKKKAPGIIPGAFSI